MLYFFKNIYGNKHVLELDVSDSFPAVLTSRTQSDCEEFLPWSHPGVARGAPPAE